MQTGLTLKKLALVPVAALAMCTAWSAPAGAQTLRLIAADHPAETMLQVRVGEIIRVHLVADFESIDAAGLAAYVTVPEGAFEVLDLGLPGQIGTQPFRAGPMFPQAILPTNMLVPETGFAADLPGQQLDLATLSSIDRQAVRGSGIAATFEILALAPTQGAVIQIDSTPIRETRMVLADGRSERRFRSTGALAITVTDGATAVHLGGWAGVKRRSGL